MGGTHRVAGVLGPLLGGAVATLASNRWSLGAFALWPPLAAAWSCFALRRDAAQQQQQRAQARQTPRHKAAAAAAVTATQAAEESSEDSSVREQEKEQPMGTRALLRAYRREFVSVGTFVALLFVVRRGRDVLLPLAGLALGLDVAEIAAVSSTTFFTGACMFPVSGYIMDNFGPS